MENNNKKFSPIDIERIENNMKDDSEPSSKILLKQKNSKQDKSAKKSISETMLKKDEILRHEAFSLNNWLENNNPILTKLHDLGGALYISRDGKLIFRINAHDHYKIISKESIINILCSVLKKDRIHIFTAPKGEMIDIKRDDLEVVQEKFTVDAKSEFYKEENLTYRTAFIPTQYLLTQETDCNEPIAIFKLIRNLCNNEDFEFNYVVNWLAGFIQTLNKPHSALIFAGDHGSGKNMLVEQVLRPIFGDKYTSVIDNERLASRFNDSWANEKILYVFNEISVSKGPESKIIKNKMKALITDATIQVESKGKNAMEIAGFGASIILSNESLPIEIESGDRRYFVIKTGRNLKRQNINTSKLVVDIQSELMDFAIMMKNYDVDWELYRANAPMTALKDAIINNTNDPIKLFVDAIKSLNFDFFDELMEIQPDYYTEIKQYFEDGKIVYSNLSRYFEILYPEEFRNSRRFMKDLRLQDPILFAVPANNERCTKSSGRDILRLE